MNLPSSRNAHRTANAHWISLALTPGVKTRVCPPVCVPVNRNAKFWTRYRFVRWSACVHRIPSPTLTANARRLVHIDFLLKTCCAVNKILLSKVSFNLFFFFFNVYCLDLGDVQCHLDQDCANHEKCLDGRCVDACLTTQCGFNAQCKSTSHTGICFCSQDFTGNAYIECIRGKHEIQNRASWSLSCNCHNCFRSSLATYRHLPEIDV